MKDYERSISIYQVQTKLIRSIRSHIPHTFIIVMDFYNRDHFIQYVLQVTRYVWFQYIEFYNFVILYNLVEKNRFR